MFDPGLNLSTRTNPLGIFYEGDVYGPTPEVRRLDAIRASLRDPDCAGPEEVYAIAMDVGRLDDRALLEQHMLLLGIVTFAAGRLGSEPIRSQGHVHAISPHSGWSPPEIYEVWKGRAVFYMQESTGEEPGRCFAVSAGPGEIVITPPGWAHANISADPERGLTFAAWCDRGYAGFDYEGVRSHGGLAWFPLLDANGSLRWERNSSYRWGEGSTLIEKPPRSYAELGIRSGVPIYRQFLEGPDLFDFVARPGRVERHWRDFIP